MAGLEMQGRGSDFEFGNMTQKQTEETIQVLCIMNQDKNGKIFLYTLCQANGGNGGSTNFDNSLGRNGNGGDGGL